jgi:hypothetical protein
MIFMILKFRDSVEICLIFVCIQLQVYFLSKMLARNMPPCETTKCGASGLLPRKHRTGNDATPRRTNGDQRKRVDVFTGVLEQHCCGARVMVTVVVRVSLCTQLRVRAQPPTHERGEN